MTDDLPRAFLPHWAELRTVDEISGITGGELKDVFRLDSGAGSFVLRIYTNDVSAADVASELALTERLAERIPEVPAAIATRRGAPQATEDRRTAVLTAFVAGDHPTSRNLEHRRAAAEMLARLHGMAASLEARPRAGYPPYRELDWHTNRWWAWPEVERYLREQQVAVAAQVQHRVAGELSALPGELAALSKLILPTMPIHNDYFPGNLIERNERIVGVVDWDECTVDWRALEVANAACEFARAEDKPYVDLRLVGVFIDDYVRAGGELLDREIESLRRLRRLRLLWETLYELGRACRGSRLGWTYLWDNLASLDSIARLY